MLDKYIEELEKDLGIERFSLDEKTLMVPGIKGKWLSKMAKHKKEQKNYERLLTDAKAKLFKEYETNSDIAYTKATLDKLILGEDIIVKIYSNINAERSLVEFCEKALSITSSMTYDIKNIIEWSKLELT